MAVQDYDKEYDIFIIANNCNDDLWSFLNEKNKQLNGRLTLHRTKIGQLAFNLNYGINLITKEYIVRMDADDVSEKNRLRVLEKHIIQNKYPDVIGSFATIIDTDGNFLRMLRPPTSDKDIKGALHFKNSFIHPTTAIKKNALLNAKGYANGLNSEDYDLWLRMYRLGSVFANINEPLLRYRINPYQTKGSRLAYAESCSHLLREFLVTGKPKFFFGFIFNIFKYLVKIPSSH